MSQIRQFWLLSRLRRNVRLKTEQLLQIQEEKLRSLLRHAYQNVEYYHRKFDSSGLKPDDIRTVNDLAKLPLTTKDEVRKNFPMKITARNIDLHKCARYKTSGSTGMPLTVVVDPSGNEYRAALFGRPFFENGLKLRDRMMIVADARTFPKGEKWWFQKLGVMQRRYFSATESVEEHLPRILDFAPNAIYAYSSYLFLLAKTIRAMEVKPFSPKLIFSTAEVLGDQTRSLIESVFETKVFDLYGSVETERLSWECEQHDGYHMDVDSAVIEFIRDGEQASPGEEGKIVVTCLYNYAMPLIRYDIGDLGVPTLEKCACGRGLPLMKRVLGRQDDLIVRPDGRMIISPIFMNIMRAIPGIYQYRIVQEDKNEITIFLVKDDKFDDNTTRKIIEDVSNIVGKEVQINVSIVENIEKEKSGKIRAVISHVKEDS